jgi:[acyl-carrier-protein] S-malonyltransferase
MGKDLAGASAAAARTWAEADDILGFALSRLCFEGPEDELRATANAQPAILVHSIAAHRVMSERIGRAAFAPGH